MKKSQEVRSSFQGRPAYRYLRVTDKLPTEIPGSTPLGDIIAKVKLFNPTGVGTWYIAAYDPDTGIAYGVSDLQGPGGPETGDIYIPELVAYRDTRFRLPIERDLHWRPRRLVDLLKGHQT